MNQTDKQGRSDTADTVNASASSRPNTIKRDQRQNVRSTIPYLKKKTKSSDLSLESTSSDLCDDGILDLAVDGTKLLGEQLFGLVNETLNTVLDAVLGRGDLVATAANDVGVVLGTTTVPGKELNF